MKTVGLVGVGLVGMALAENLLKAGYGLVGFDVRSERNDLLKKAGGRAAANPADLVRQVQAASAEERPVVVLSLLDTGIVGKVLDEADGILAVARPGLILVDTSTGDPDEEAAIAARLAGSGISYLDATISGSSEQIRARCGVFMVGGDEPTFRELDGIFGALAEKRFFLGPSGSGARAKLASNLILGLNRLALAEGLVFAEKLGLEPGSFLELLKHTPAYSCAMDVKGRKMIDGDFAPQSRLAQHDKDLRMILACAEQAGQGLPLAGLHKRLLEAAMAAGDGELDTSAVIKQIRKSRPGSSW